ncbi:SRPBCC family protein [Cellulosimicrobium sp. Marseille-Q8652]
MTTRHSARRSVDAPLATVWDVLTDVERMPTWTPSMTSVHLLDGDRLAEGVTVEIRQPRLPTMVWTVDEVVPRERFGWSTTRGGVVTRADHRLAPRADGRSTDVWFEIHQTGRLARLVGALTMRRTARYVDLEIDGLREASEAAADLRHESSGPDA